MGNDSTEGETKARKLEGKGAPFDGGQCTPPTPAPIPNSEAKPGIADDTTMEHRLESLCHRESRTPPERRRDACDYR